MSDIKEVLAKCTRFQGGKPLATFKLVYDAPTSQLEPIYFWLLDFMQERGDKVEKIVDNFTASPGSGHFAEIGARATRMQEEGMKIMGLINQVVKTILNLIYDLKEFEIRLGHYNDANSEDKEKKEAALLALKQIWLDNVDMKRGRGSIHQMTYEMGFTTLRDAFMIVNSIEEAEKMAGKEGIVNDQVKRILIPRISEFIKWREYSEKELNKRYQIEKSYLRTEVESLKLYVSWAKPYLKAAEELRMKGFDKGNPALVNAFNTAMFDLVILGKKPVNFKNAVMAKQLPPVFADKVMKRTYNAINLVSFIFRGIPQKVTQQNYGFGGRVEVTFDAYSLSDEEMALFAKLREKDDIESSIKFVAGEAEHSLDALKDDIDHFLNNDSIKKKEEENKKDTDPFSALFSLFKSKKEDEKDKKEINDLKDIKKDDYVEGYVRNLAGSNAKTALYLLYDVYKKAHGHASSPQPFNY